ncbi:RNB-domain-containing protein [Metschnikowia bicuspidata var. bicuspidata NRRL YB-4993]|uniref:RNB-domain-containing protein n=1 Tax=Metschnikowia bicuspidata var. bicuspidata NRRL YB-4993 TaxID=869754 RepID=A0A1A0HA36_9ASCO|nr:RNB-domain-containing protein [Metschnikowia bicuspidata var. bicuspidata NRRL YB-4993]OBA20865.1 RNB-domain-containing protein [Metschnikowia bicuspidata var. bicuspidata NRRL YB-4993]
MRPASILRRLQTRWKPKNAPKHKLHNAAGLGLRLPKKVEQAAHEALKQRPYYDPANSTLDFRKSNRTLLREITAQSTSRTRVRVKGPAEKWARLLGNTSQAGALKDDARNAITAARISQASSLRPLAVGDVVILHEKSTLLHLVVAAPGTLALDVYTFINHEGEVMFGTKHHVRMRIPGVLPSALAEKMRLVVLEAKMPGVAPVGVPDCVFSRLKKAPSTGPRDAAAPLLLPLEPAPASLDAQARDFTVAQASAQLLADTSVNTYVVPTTARAVYAPLFTEISIDAFRKIPAFSHKLDYFHRVLQYDDGDGMIQSACTIPIFDLFNMVMAHEVPGRGLRSATLDEHDYKQARARLRKSARHGSQALGKALPSQTAPSYAVATYSASSYIAFVSALSRLGRKWKINVQKSTRTPISVDVLPLSRARSVDSTLDYLRNGGVDEIAAYIVSRVRGGARAAEAPPQYRPVVQMLKDFVSGNILGDHNLDSLLGNLVLSVDARLKAAGLDRLAAALHMPFSHEFARLRAYEILMLLETTGDRNPLRWDSALGLPGTQSSAEADRFWRFYDYLDSTFRSNGALLGLLQGGAKSPARAENDTPERSQDAPAALAKYLADDFYPADPMAAVREDFGNTPVYCIDSETAHEIDDGISIEDTGAGVAITVHIANPTSYLKPDSSLSQIALQKGSTVYLPEGPTMMLPDVISKLCGLNGEKTTRTLGIRFVCKKKHVKAYHDALRKDPSVKPLVDLAQAIQNAIEHTATVKFYNVSNFPKNFTYKKVNEILNDPENVERFQNNTLKEGSHEHNLFSLHMMADLIKHFRVSLGSGVELNSDTSKVAVNFSKDDCGEQDFTEIESGWQITLPKGKKSDTPVISVMREVNQNKESKSQHLVSNLMIAANYAGSVFAEREGFPIIHRHLKLDVKESVANEIKELSRRSYLQKKDMRPDERSQLLSVLTTANFLTFQLSHDLLGVKLYLNLTSPLRRYVDMVNHWKFQDFTLMKEAERRGEDWIEFGMRTSDMDYIASHLQGCELRNKMAQKFSDTFWKAKFLRRYFELKIQGKIKNPIELLFLLGSDAKHGDVRAELIGFTSLRTTIIQTPYVMLKFSSETWHVGQVIRNPRFRVLKLDFIEGEFTIELVSPEDALNDIIE